MTSTRDNPYYEEWREMDAAHPAPKERAPWAKKSERFSLMRAGRDRMVSRYAWAIPSNRVIGRLAKLGPIVEMGAGTGYWAKLLSEAGCDVVAYDIRPPLTSKNHYFDKVSWFDVQKGGPEELAVHGDRTLMLCWPPYDRNLASASLAAYPGDRLIYVGEMRSGCTGDSNFFDALDADWVQVGRGRLPQWPRIWDELGIYQRRGRVTT